MIIDQLLTVLMLTSGFLVLYHHLLFPLWLNFYRRRHPLPPAPDPQRHFSCQPDDQQLPSITLIIPAFNEAAVIAEKINNLGALDYPAERLQLLLIGDGCSDDTVALARRQQSLPENRHLNQQTRDYRCNRGKIAVLNREIPRTATDIVALSDASALISADALLIAARHFRSTGVAVVTGGYRLLKPGSEGEDTYWRYQTAIKQGEAALGSPMGAHGAFYLFRRSLFSALPDDTINDDFILPMSLVARGYRAIYEPKILALELEQASTSQDRSRRQRIAAGNLQQLIRLRALLHPRYAGVALIFASGKALRTLMPFLLLALYGSSLALAGSHPLAALLALGQTLVYLLALAAHLQPRWQQSGKIQTLYYLVSGHCSGLIGSIRYLSGGSRALWQASTRAREETP